MFVNQNSYDPFLNLYSNFQGGKLTMSRLAFSFTNFKALCLDFFTNVLSANQ